MRYKLYLTLDGTDEIPKDKNRLFLSLIKNCICENDADFFNKLYVKNITKRKNFTYSLYMKNAVFLRDTIKIPEKKIVMNFSTNNYMTGIQFCNSMLKAINRKYVYKGEIEMHVENIELVHEHIFTSDKTIFRTLSPIVIREHNRETNRNWFHSISSEKGKALFLENLKYQILESIPEAIPDIDKIDISVIRNKEVKVKHYGIEVNSNLCVFEMKAAPYILNFCYQSGILAYASTGFGMLEVM
ncbi:MAG: CRISPR-associated endoribonuclease Cas6 [Eubacterium sp.]|nr:CRISPR-associated endoribonuclease Cas6 [Gallibacter sp.]MDY6038204.1 CRISPR-associated endoribonuclease Cas6 [Eubacterium sp.]